MRPTFEFVVFSYLVVWCLVSQVLFVYVVCIRIHSQINSGTEV